MENLSKRKRDEMIAFLEFLKKQHSDDDSLMAINSIEIWSDMGRTSGGS